MARTTTWTDPAPKRFNRNTKTGLIAHVVGLGDMGDSIAMRKQRGVVPVSAFRRSEGEQPVALRGDEIRVP